MNTNSSVHVSWAHVFFHGLVMYMWNCCIGEGSPVSSISCFNHSGPMTGLSTEWMKWLPTALQSLKLTVSSGLFFPFTVYCNKVALLLPPLGFGADTELAQRQYGCYSCKSKHISWPLEKQLVALPLSASRMKYTDIEREQASYQMPRWKED